MQKCRVVLAILMISVVSLCVYFGVRRRAALPSADLPGRPAVPARVPCIEPRPEAITRIVHQSWKNATIPPVFERFLPSWKACFPDWEHKFWSDADNRDLVVRHFPWLLELYESFPKEIYRADLARYLYLYLYGGLYTDLDNECLAPFAHLLEKHSFVFGAIEGLSKITALAENYVQNSFMYSRPRQPFWLELVNSVRKMAPYETADIVTGPSQLCAMIDAYRRACPASHGIKIYEAWRFNPLSWGGAIKYSRCRVSQYMGDADWRICREMLRLNGSFVVQYHLHQWGPQFP